MRETPDRRPGKRASYWRGVELRAPIHSSLLLLVGCAQGAAGLPDWKSEGNSSTPGIFLPDEVCELGETMPCDCDDGTVNGQRTCAEDPQSPLDGFWTACTGCVAPQQGGLLNPEPPWDAGTEAPTNPGSSDSGAHDAAASAPSCTDGQKNGTESDVDCGGGCGACAAGQMCIDASDCDADASCTGGVCTPNDASGSPGTPAAPSSPDFRNYDHDSYSYTRSVDWSCAGTTRFDSTGSGSWVQSSSCSSAETARPEVTCGVAQKNGGPPVCILRARGLTIGAGHTLELVGDKPVILAVEGDATIAGTVSASASGTTPGAGGNLSCSMSQGGDGTGSTTRLVGASGGGGGGFGTAGGAGGVADTNGVRKAGGTGGTQRGNATLTPLLGGCAGGRAGGCTAAGGAGGGAVQIAATGTLTVRGTIRADGGNGATPCGQNDQGGGTGGGSGGGILLEGGTVDIAGATLSARGGQGGANGTYASIYRCGGTPGGSGAAAPNQSGTMGANCQGGSPGGGGGYGRVVVP